MDADYSSARLAPVRRPSWFLTIKRRSSDTRPLSYDGSRVTGIVTTAEISAADTTSVAERTAFVALPIAFVSALAAFGLLQEMRQTPALRWSFLITPLALGVWTAWLFLSARRRHRRLVLEIALRKQH